MAFFTDDAIDFFRELELNNEKSWFEANKKRYETSVKRPMEAFVGRLIELMKELDPQIAMTPKDAIFRIYKDVRFSKDKTPYKTNAGASISRGGRRAFDVPGIYFHFDPRILGIASGYYSLEPDKIARMRRHLMAHPKELAERLADPEFKMRFGDIAGERNKVLPPEFKEAAKSLPYLANKQFYYWAENDVKELLRNDLDEFVIAHFRAAQPMNSFLAHAFA